METIVIDFCLNQDIKITRNFDLKNKTWIQRGGIAGVFIEPDSREKLISLCRLLYKNKYEFEIIGYTSNLYIHNDYHPDIVISTINIKNVSEINNTIICDCGVKISTFSKECVKKGYLGFEGLVDLPGTVASAVYNNSSCFGCSIKDLLIKIELLNSNGDIITLYPDGLKFLHRSSALKRKELKGTILTVYLKKEISDPELLIKKATLNHIERKRKQESGRKNLGSTFAKLGSLPLFIRIILKTYSLISRVLNIGKEKQQYTRIIIILFLSGYLRLLPYISRKNINCFIWKDEKADEVFELYRVFMKKIYKTEDLEIEIKDGKNKKKKVGIITYMLNNYGAVLQAYALQAYLKKNINLEVYNINFKTKLHDKQDRIFKFSKSLKSDIAMLVFTFLRYKGLRKRKVSTDEFKKCHFTLTRTYSDYNELISSPPLMDVYVTGSDQVFNPSNIYRDAFYLNFKSGNAKKVAYAPSFGVNTFNEEFSRSIESLVADFKALSCREKEGADFLSQITGKEVPWLVDPTFLIDAKEWEKLCVRPPINEKYIFIYALTGENYLIDIAKKIRNKTGYKILYQRHNIRSFVNVDKVMYDSGPAEFLGFIRNAEILLTDSFHGTVFSTIFDKPFYTFITRPKVSTRIYNLANILDIYDRIVTPSTLNDIEFSTIPYKTNKDRLNQMIEQSKSFIQKNIIDENI